MDKHVFACLSCPLAKMSEMVEEEQEDPYLNDRCRGETRVLARAMRELKSGLVSGGAWPRVVPRCTGELRPGWASAVSHSVLSALWAPSLPSPPCRGLVGEGGGRWA